MTVGRAFGEANRKFWSPIGQILEPKIAGAGH
jgi:hypothetical protein